MDFPVIPDDLGALDSEALRTLCADLKAWGREHAPQATPESLVEFQKVADAVASIDATLAQRATDEAAFADNVTALSSAFAADEPKAEPAKTEAPAHKAAEKATEPKAEPKAEPAKAPEADKAAPVPGVGHEPSAPEPNPAAPEGGPQFSAPNLILMNDEAPKTPVPTRGVPVSALRASAGVSGMSAGDSFADAAALGRALMERFKDIQGGGAEKIAVAKAFANFDEAHTLSDSIPDNIAKFGGVDSLASEAITAAVCAPAMPIYELGAMSSTERPVRNSMAQYGAPRGAVTIYPNPMLSDITDQSAGTGIWTAANDADDTATKACAVIPCSTPVQYDIYGVYRCLTVTNLMQMTFPELVTAFLNRLGALQARLAEKTLLNAMVNSVNTFNLTTAATDFGASVDMWTTLIQSIAVYREQERYGDQTLDAWIPRWVGSAIQMDIATQRHTAGPFQDRLVSIGEITAALTKLSVNVTWTLDDATNWTSVDAQADGTPATLVSLPTTATFMLSPQGNFRVLDRGDLSIGVTNNNLYRDNASNLKNQFTFFFENFEGLVDFGTRSYEVEITNFNPSGIQVGDFAEGGHIAA